LHFVPLPAGRNGSPHAEAGAYAAAEAEFKKRDYPAVARAFHAGYQQEKLARSFLRNPKAGAAPQIWRPTSRVVRHQHESGNHVQPPLARPVSIALSSSGAHYSGEAEVA
jgi:hypothetical protein